MRGEAAVTVMYNGGFKLLVLQQSWNKEKCKMEGLGFYFECFRDSSGKEE